MLGKISRDIGVQIKARNLRKEALLPWYYTLVFPYLTNGDQVWGSDFNDKIDILNKLQQGPSEW